MSSSTLLANDLPIDPDYEASLDPSAGTVIPSPFPPYAHAIVPYPFDPSKIFNKPMFFMVEHLVSVLPTSKPFGPVLVKPGYQAGGALGPGRLGGARTMPRTV
jgi:hypothetical protein